MAKPRLPAGCSSTWLKPVIATVAANRRFTRGDLLDYVRWDARARGCNLSRTLDVLVKRGFVERVDRGQFFPTHKGWRWIEGR